LCIVFVYLTCFCRFKRFRFVCGLHSYVV